MAGASDPFLPTLAFRRHTWFESALAKDRYRSIDKVGRYLPPTRSLASRISQLCTPMLSSIKAVARPEMPPPTMAMDAFDRRGAAVLLMAATPSNHAPRASKSSMRGLSFLVLVAALGVWIGLLNDGRTSAANNRPEARYKEDIIELDAFHIEQSRSIISTQTCFVVFPHRKILLDIVGRAVDLSAVVPHERTLMALSSPSLIKLIAILAHLTGQDHQDITEAKTTDGGALYSNGDTCIGATASTALLFL